MTHAHERELIERSVEEVRFPVDEVGPIEQSFRVRPAETVLAKAAPGTLWRHQLSDPSQPVLAGTVHALVGAVQAAFQNHRPLILDPDIVWLTIAQGFANHLLLHAEEHRQQLVEHQGKMKLTVEEFGSPDDVDVWIDAVSKFVARVGEHARIPVRSWLECDFSTTTPTTRMASQITIMLAFRPFFEYEMLCICGIPQVTLRGTVDDWKSIRRRVETLPEFGLEWWTVHLRTILDEFVLAAEGRPSKEFWSRIYQPREAYGGDEVTGWLADLFPYVLGSDETPSVRNPRFGVTSQKHRGEGGDLDRPGAVTPESRTMSLIHPEPGGDSGDAGVSVLQFPNGAAEVPVTVEFEGSSREFLLFAGPLLVRVDGDGSMRPEIVWGLSHPPQN